MKALVTGGGGFLGGAILRQWLAQGHSARSFSRGEYPELKALGVEHFSGDLSHADLLISAAEGCDVVFHVAAKAGIWGSYEDYYQTNVVGTENVIRACRKNKIPRLVYTSSPSVVFNGKDMEGVDESVPYAEHYEAHYPKTKAMAEQLVLKSNGKELATIALRPHLIWGPKDPHLVPRIIAQGRKGLLRKIGDRPCRVDSIYIENAAQAHLLAAERLHPGSPVAGKVYFISQGEPLPVWDLINKILKAAHLPPITRHLSPGIAYAAGWLLEKAYPLLRLKGEPRMTRFLAHQLSTAHWFNIQAAQKDLGYSPRISLEEGMRRLEKSLS